jgi:hypothetical protein
MCCLVRSITHFRKGRTRGKTGRWSRTKEKKEWNNVMSKRYRRRRCERKRIIKMRRKKRKIMREGFNQMPLI